MGAGRESKAPQRRVADILGRHTRGLAPASRHGWAEAMNNELAHVPGDWAALRWAGGCLLVALGERILSLALLDVAAVRVIGALLIGFRAFAAVFATALTLAYRSNALVSVERLGAMTPGDDYTRLVPLIEAVPLWLHSLWMLVAAL